MRSERGSVLILTAASATMLLTLAAFSLSLSMAYQKRNTMAAAADAAAKTGAIEVFIQGTSVAQSTLQNFGNREVQAHGLSSTTLTIRQCNALGATCTSPYAGDAHYVEAIVADTSPVFFNLLPLNVLNPSVRAVAGIANGTSCLVGLGSSGTSFTTGGGATSVTMPGCNITSNSNISIGNGSGSITSGGISAVGSCSGTCTNVTTGAPPASDPLANVLTFPTTNPYAGTAGMPISYVLGNNQPPDTLSPGWYSKIDIGNSDIITLNSGVYYITGPILIKNSAHVTGSGVTFLFAGSGSGSCTAASTAGCINIDNNAVVTLSATVGGTYNGILFFQQPGNNLPATFANSGTFDLSGAMYFPTAAVSFGNSGGSNDCTLFVAASITISGGNTSFSNTCSAYGGSPIKTVALAE